MKGAEVMEPVRLLLKDLEHSIIQIGYVGENNHIQVQIDCAEVFEKYPEAIVSMAVSNPLGQIYPSIIEKEGDDVLWTVTSSDVSCEGDGNIQLTFINGEEIIKTATGKTRIKNSIVGNGPAPDPIIDFVTRADTVLARIPNAIDSALEEAKESGEFDGPPGYTPQKGIDYMDGQDGVSPIVTITNIAGGHRVVITDTEGPHSFDVMDGQGGGGSGTVDDELSDTSTNPVQNKVITEEVTSLKEAITNITEDYAPQYGWVSVPITSPLEVRENKRCADSYGEKIPAANQPTVTEGMNNSSVTDCVMSAFECEVGKKYRLTITNGQTPASVAERGTIVIATRYNANPAKNLVKETFRHTNTSNATDVFTFTPSVAGYVYFNLDANFQSIAVDVEEVVGMGKTAVDDAVRDHVLNKEIETDLAFSSGTFDSSLVDASGSGYRSQIVTGVKDCAICIKVDPDYTAMFGNGTDALVTVHGSYVYHSTKDSVRFWISDTVANSGFEVRIYKEKGHRGEYDVIVAASDSSDVDKQIADIVCDGTNDEVDLQFAVNWNFYRHIGNSSRDAVNVLLLPGNYYIDNFETKETLHGDDTVAQYAVMVGNDSFSGNAGYYYSASINGTAKTGHCPNGAITKINVTNGAVATLSSEVENVLIGVCRAGSRTGGGIHMNALCIEVKNLTIFTNGANNQIVALDGYTAGISIFENNDVWSVSSTSSWTPTSISEIPSGSIGIRAGDGSCYGVRQSIKGNRISGYHEGLAIVGEHFIIQDNIELRCTYGFTVNQYDHNGANQHPNVFIGNSVEQCYYMGKLGSYTSKQTLVYIGGSVENMIDNSGGEDVAMLPIQVSNDTKYRGRIESDSLADPYDESMFESGKGTNFEQVIYPYAQA